LPLLKNIPAHLYHFLSFQPIKEIILLLVEKSNIFITFAMKSSELLRKLTRNRWIIERQTGSHLVLFHPNKSGFLVVPYHGTKEIGKGIASDILKQAGLR
jgi:predicted RNA binding protein YcfA (HicA-like mRNA interferase family)